MSISNASRLVYSIQPATKSWTLIFAGATAAVVFAGSSVSWAQLAVQPADKHSFLITNSTDGNGRHKGIRDDDFAALLKNKFQNSGVKDVKVMFEQCYGGGMLDDIQTAMNALGVPYVGGSASTWDKPSYGELSKAENDALPAAKKSGPPYVVNPPGTPLDYWLKALIPGIDNNAITLKKALENARDNDQVGQGATDPYGKYETPQVISGNNGDQITLRDPTAQSHHAILWAGAPDGMRHYNDIDKMRTSLMNAWGNGPNVSVSVLFGDGANKPDGTALPAGWNAQAATVANLQNVLNNLPLDSNEQFLFFGSDHGGSSTTIKDPVTIPKPVLPRTRDIELCSLTQGELDGMLYDDTDFATIEVGYSGVLSTTDAPVYWNNNLLGFLPPSSIDSGIVLQIPDAWLQLDNQIFIDNNNFTSPFNLNYKTFFTGAITTLAPVPEPMSLGLLGVVGASLLFRRKRK